MKKHLFQKNNKSENNGFFGATTTILVAVAMIAFMSIATKVNANQFTRVGDGLFSNQNVFKQFGNNLIHFPGTGTYDISPYTVIDKNNFKREYTAFTTPALDGVLSSVRSRFIQKSVHPLLAASDILLTPKGLLRINNAGSNPSFVNPIKNEQLPGWPPPPSNPMVLINREIKGFASVFTSSGSEVSVNQYYIVHNTLYKFNSIMSELIDTFRFPENRSIFMPNTNQLVFGAEDILWIATNMARGVQNLTSWFQYCKQRMDCIR